MVSEIVQIYETFAQVFCVSPHNITVVLAAVNTWKQLGILQLSSKVTLLRDGIGQRNDMQIVA